MPQGESFNGLIARVEQWLQAMVNLHQPVDSSVLAVVTHAGVIRALAVICQGATIAQALSVSAPFGGVLAFEYPSAGK